ncbi:unnamed protein product [Knipowitschia caucasica]
MRIQEKNSSDSETSSQSETSNHKPVWIDHKPTPDSSSSLTDSTPPYVPKNGKKSSLKSRFKTLLRLDKKTEDEDSDVSLSTVQILPNGTRVSPPVSPPVSPLLGRKRIYLSDTSQTSEKNFLKYDIEDSLLTSIHPAEDYAEKVEIYNLKYSYLKSWPGLLRMLAGLQLLFGGMVFACIIAYVHKNSEWTNAFGNYNGGYNNGLSGYSYGGPMTAFVLAIAGVSWIVTLVLLVVGMTMYYRTILLDSPWWPLTEALINMVVFLLMMSAGIVYVNDLNRGGLCFTTIGMSPIMASLCRVEGGQAAGTAFLFLDMGLYLASFLVCLKMWRHEAARREREAFLNQPTEVSAPLETQKPKRISFKDQTDAVGSQRPHVEQETDRSNGSATRRPVSVIADYIMKYPEIQSVEQREEYRAVFNDQYPEYRDLHGDITLTLAKFRRLDALMQRLLSDRAQNPHRVQSLLRKLEEKKNEPAFWEKKKRCDYLKAKLGHLKNRIHTFDRTTDDHRRPIFKAAVSAERIQPIQSWRNGTKTCVV